VIEVFLCIIDELILFVMFIGDDWFGVMFVFFLVLVVMFVIVLDVE